MKPHFKPFYIKYMAGCQQPFLSKMAGDNRLSAAIFGPNGWLSAAVALLDMLDNLKYINIYFYMKILTFFY